MAIPSTPCAVCAGDACVDTYLPPTSRAFLGGNAVNTAVALARAGFPAAFAGACGSDAPASALRAALHRAGVITDHLTALPGPTNLSHVRLLPCGEREFVHALNPPRLSFDLSPQTIAWILTQRLLHVNWLWPAFAEIAAFRAAPLPLSVDYGEHASPEFIERTLPLASLAFFSLPPARADEAPALARAARSQGPHLVVVTLGHQGSLALDREEHFYPAVPARPVDTLGAGDSYIGTFLALHLLGRPVDACMAAAARAAAQTCAIVGGWPGAEIS